MKRNKLSLTMSMGLTLVSLLNLNAATYYVDPDYIGAHTGTAANPDQSINWTRVNTTLGFEPVTIVISALTAGGVTEQVYSATGATSVADYIDLNLRTSTSAHKLTIDGTSQYNSNDITPNWLVNPYAGTRRCWVKYVNSQNDTHLKRSNMKVYGLHIACLGENKGLTVAGDNWEVLSNEIEHTGHFSGGGPLLLVVPTADGSHEGSSAYSPQLTNIVIGNNLIHDSQGELIYVGGGGSSPGSAGSGYPSHNGITITNNIGYNAGIYGDQGDGTDVKGGITGLYYADNYFHDVGVNTNGPVRGFVMQGQYGDAVTTNINYILRNKFGSSTNIEDGVIVIADSWGTSCQTVIGANVITGCTRAGATPAGVKIYSSGALIGVYNNTIVGVSGVGFYFETGSTIAAKNNILSGNNGGAAQVDYRSSTVSAGASDYNSYVGSSWGYGSEGVHTASTSNAANFVDFAGGDYTLISTAAVKGTGVAVASITLDRNRVAYTSPPSRGAFEYDSGGVAPSLPAVPSYKQTGNTKHGAKFSIK